MAVPDHSLCCHIAASTFAVGLLAFFVGATVVDGSYQLATWPTTFIPGHVVWAGSPTKV